MDSQAAFKIPILFIIFNRKGVALETLMQIRKIAPTQLFLAGDGPRDNKPGEAERVAATRAAILDAIDWPCEVNTLFQETNLGCGLGVYQAINWFFERVDMGIILEDDCKPLISFFPFCEALLQRYRDDLRIGGITGYNPSKKELINESYCFSEYVENWGWATWRRAWQNMDMEMSWLQGPHRRSIIDNTGFLGKDHGYWEHNLKKVAGKKVSAWDIQWCFSVAAQNQLTIYPKWNLIENIGEGEEATHTATISPFLNYKVHKELDFPLVHPPYTVPNLTFDRELFEQRNNLLAKLARFFPEDIKSAVKRNLHRFNKH